MAKSLYDVVGFGKHKDDLLIDVMNNDYQYIKWCMSKEIIEIDNEAMQLFIRLEDGQ